MCECIIVQNGTYTFPYLLSSNEDSDMLLNREIFIAQTATIIETSKRDILEIILFDIKI